MLITALKNIERNDLVLSKPFIFANLTMHNVKKLFFALAAGMFVALVATSCRTHQTCPGYGDAGKVIEKSHS